MSCFALICAAGVGKRFGGNTPKQFLFLKDKMIVEYSLDVFESSDMIDGIALMIPDGYEDIVKNLKLKYKKLLLWDFGEDKRSKTVKKGLDMLKNMCDYVAIHDAARPFITKQLIEDLIELSHRYLAVSPATCSKDTVKYVLDGLVERTIPRDEVFFVQTPQVFKYDIIYKAHSTYKDEDFTDDLQYVEKMGIKPKIIVNSSLNLKITTKEDFMIASAIVEQFYNLKG